ncbi:diguanylate cyclase [Niveibacterium sp.]|uniref:sensor domain-containing diguanylate cyclase n=1 Tax=Niveibacterium sp. TaxID=2017444 RepID=UPI0035B2962A
MTTLPPTPASPPERETARPDSARYGAVSMRALLLNGTQRERFLIFGAWLASIAISVAFGLATVAWGWSGIPLLFGGVKVFITIYPPLLICQLWTLCFGWWWGAVPAYLATLVLALYAGMPPHWALLFACANPLGFAVLSLGYRAMGMSRALRSLRSWLFYVQMCFVAGVFSSAGALIWCYTNRIDTIGQLPIWQGWWLGAFVQGIAIVAPLLMLGWPAIEQWQQRRPALLHRESADPRRLALRLTLAVVAGVVGYGFLSLSMGAGRVDETLRSGELALLPAAAEVMLSTTWVFFWVFALIVVFVGLFGYKVFVRWMDETDRLVARLEHANSELAVLSRTDGLTGLYNRATIDALLQEAWQRAKRFGEQPCSLLILDIDHFKQINDRYGHAVGDAVIRSVATAIRESTRGADSIGRFGGEEFIVILPATDAPGAEFLAERIRLRIEQTELRSAAGPIHFTVSIGAADFRVQDDDATAWLRRADAALYRAKAAGRNRTHLAGDAEVHVA